MEIIRESWYWWVKALILIVLNLDSGIFLSIEKSIWGVILTLLSMGKFWMQINFSITVKSWKDRSQKAQAWVYNEAYPLCFIDQSNLFLLPLIKTKYITCPLKSQQIHSSVLTVWYEKWEKWALFWGFQHTFFGVSKEIDGKMFIFRVNLGMWPLESIVSEQKRT